MASQSVLALVFYLRQEEKLWF